MRNKRDGVSLTATSSSPDIGFSYNELARELSQELNGIPLQDNDVTSVMMAEVWGINVSTARRRLEFLVKKGKLISPGRTIVHGAWTKVYRKKI